MTAPTGFLWRPYTDLRTAISGSSTFQAWVGVADAAAALAKIRMYEDRTDLHSDAKYAVVLPPDTIAAELTKTSGMGNGGLAAYDWTRAVMVGFLWELTEAELGAGNTDYSEANITSFLSTAGAIINDLLTADAMAMARTVTVMPLTGEARGLRWREGEHNGYQVFFIVQLGT